MKELLRVLSACKTEPAEPTTLKLLSVTPGGSPDGPLACVLYSPPSVLAEDVHIVGPVSFHSVPGERIRFLLSARGIVGVPESVGEEGAELLRETARATAVNAREVGGLAGDKIRCLVSYAADQGCLAVSFVVPPNVALGTRFVADDITLRGVHVLVSDPVTITVGYCHSRIDGGAVFEAARAGDAAAIQHTLAAGGSTEEFSSARRGRTCLHAAIYGSFEDAARTLISAGATIDALDSNQQTPLHYAVDLGDARLVNFLLASGASVSAGSPYVLGSAIRKGRVDIVRALLYAGADPNHSPDEHAHLNYSCVHVAAAQGHTCTGVACLQALLEAGGRVQAFPVPQVPLCGPMFRGRAGVGETPLHCASTPEAVRVLIAAGADVNARDADDATPLHSAAALGRASVVRELLAVGADAAATNRSGRTPLELGSSYSDCAAEFRRLQAKQSCAVM